MKQFLYTLLLLICLGGNCFSQNDTLQKQINEQVWKPFIQSFNNRNDDTYEAVHSKDVIRVLQDDNQIFGYKEYFKKVDDSLKVKWSTWKRSIELRFIQRIAADGRAFEVGFYKTFSVNSSTGEKRTGYGKFHVLLKKEKGVWKILMDADAKEDANEAVFQAAKPLE